MIHPHVPELALPPGFERDRLCAMRALSHCSVIRVTVGKVPLGFRLLQQDSFVKASRVTGSEGIKADCRLTPAGAEEAAKVLQGPC